MYFQLLEMDGFYICNQICFYYCNIPSNISPNSCFKLHKNININQHMASSSSYKGQSWGKLNFSNTSLKLCTMQDNEKQIFTIDYNTINNAILNKNDIVIEVGNNMEDEGDRLCEIRVFTHLLKDDQSQNSEIERSDGQGQIKNKIRAGREEKKEEKIDYAQALFKKLISDAKIGKSAGQSIITLNDVNLIVPRGKYTIDFYQTNLRFHGHTYNFTIDYKNIMKGFLLPMQNESQVNIVVQLHRDRPIYQGQTTYYNIVMQMRKDILVNAKTKLKQADVGKYSHLSYLKKEYSGPLFEVLMEVMRTVSQISFIAPDCKDFKSRGGHSCVKCGVKAQLGELYFLKKSLIFIPKPVLYFKVEEISKIYLSRLGANNKQFDLKVILSDEKKTLEFINIDRQELDSLVQYFKVKDIKVDVQDQRKDIRKPEDQQDEDEYEEDQDDGDFDGEGEGQGSEEDEEDEKDQIFEEESLSQGNKKKKGKKGKGKEKNNAGANKNSSDSSP